MQGTDKHDRELRRRELIVRMLYEGMEPSMIDVKMGLRSGTARSEILSFWRDEDKGALNGD